MAATFTVEDGTGLATANAYVSLSDADQYWEDHGDTADWSGASDANKQEAIRMGTQYLDTVYGERWIGVRANDAQALAWPRSSAYDADGYAIDSESLPIALEHAVAEAALRHITESDGLMPDLAADAGAIEREKVKADVVESDVTYAGAASQFARFRVIDLILETRGLILPAGMMERA